MAVYELSDTEIWFPKPELAEENGLLCVGGDLSMERLLLAYSNGIFPWYNPDEPILWWCPHQRFVIYPKEIKISRSMKKFRRRRLLQVTFDRDFKEVMHQCRLMREGEEYGTWIGDAMEEAYNRLFQAGYASSVECYQDGELVGGLYGVIIGKCFFGESMFSKVPNASKLALITLAEVLASWDYELIDCQFHTEHLESMGGRYISYEEYMKHMRRGIPFSKVDG